MGSHEAALIGKSPGAVRDFLHGLETTLAFNARPGLLRVDRRQGTTLPSTYLHTNGLAASKSPAVTTPNSQLDLILPLPSSQLLNSQSTINYVCHPSPVGLSWRQAAAAVALRLMQSGDNQPDDGTVSLFAALDAQSGKVIGRCHRRHRAVEFRKFLDTIEAEVPADLDVHLIVDNYATHKTALIRNWLARRPRFQLHFTPTSASWLNLVERWFALLTEKQLRRGVHQSSGELEAAIYRYSGPELLANRHRVNRSSPVGLLQPSR